MGRLFPLYVPLLSGLLASCWWGGARLEEFRGPTMGTSYSVKYVPRGADADGVEKRTEELLVSINREMSTYIADSEISRFNRLRDTGAWFAVSPTFFSVLSHSLEVAGATGGSFDPTLGPLVDLWGFGPGGQRRIPKAEDIRRVRSFVGFDLLELSREKSAVRKKHPSVSLDLSASAKGRAVDEIGRLLEASGIADYMVEIGGEVKVRGSKRGEPWEIGILGPAEGGPVVRRVLRLKDAALATSGDYFNSFKEGGKLYSHIIDYRTGRPVEDAAVGVSVVDREGDCMNADALATALMAMGLKEAVAFARARGIAAYFISGTEDGGFRETATPAFEALFGEGL